MHRPESETERRKPWWLDALATSEGLAAEYVKSHSRNVTDVMTREVITASPETSVADIATLLEKRIKRYRSWRTGRSSASSAGQTCCRASPASGTRHHAHSPTMPPSAKR